MNVKPDIKILTLLAVMLIIHSCSTLVPAYDQPRDAFSHSQKTCLSAATRHCVLEIAAQVSLAIVDHTTQSEALLLLARSEFEHNNTQAALAYIADMKILPLQFKGLRELNAFTKKPTTTQQATQSPQKKHEIQQFAASLTAVTESDRIPILLLRVLLYFENAQTADAIELINQILQVKSSSTGDNKPIKPSAEPHASDAPKPNTHSHASAIELFRGLLPDFVKYQIFNEITALIAKLATQSQQVTLQAEYARALKTSHPQLAEQQINQAQQLWLQLPTALQRQSSNALLRNSVYFNRPQHMHQILQQLTQFDNKIVGHAIILNEYAQLGNIDKTKQRLTRLLRQLRQHYAIENASSTTAVPDSYLVSSIRAQAIADLAMALAKKNQLAAALHYAEKISPLMAHIQGSTLSKLALRYAEQNQVNQALLVMESIHRSVNRDACLAQIAAIVAKTGATTRAKRITERIVRQSWRDIALSEISITLAQQNKLDAAIKIAQTITRSYSVVYALNGIAKTMLSSQNKR